MPVSAVQVVVAGTTVEHDIGEVASEGVVA